MTSEIQVKAEKNFSTEPVESPRPALERCPFCHTAYVSNGDSVCPVTVRAGEKCMLTKTEAQEIVDGLESARVYAPDEYEAVIGKAIAHFVEQFDVISDDTELFYAEKE